MPSISATSSSLCGTPGRSESRRDRVLANAESAGSRGRRSRVLAVVRARDQRLGGQVVVRGEFDAPPGPRHGPEATRHHGDVVRGLVLEDPQLRVAVPLEASVPVEVIGLEVQENRDPGPKGLDVLELEARQLADDALGLPHLAFELAQRPPDVSGRRRAEDRPQQLRGGRLPVRAGDADDRPLQVARGELDLAPHRDAALACLDDERVSPGTPGLLTSTSTPSSNASSVSFPSVRSAATTSTPFASSSAFAAWPERARPSTRTHFIAGTGCSSGSRGRSRPGRRSRR